MALFPRCKDLSSHTFHLTVGVDSLTPHYLYISIFLHIYVDVCMHIHIYIYINMEPKYGGIEDECPFQIG